VGRPGTDFVVGDVELRFGDGYIRAEPGSHTTIVVMDKPKRALSVETVAFDEATAWCLRRYSSGWASSPSRTTASAKQFTSIGTGLER
jgi:hypothetical protein